MHNNLKRNIVLSYLKENEITRGDSYGIQFVCRNVITDEDLKNGKIYSTLQHHGYIRWFTADNQTFVSLTDEGLQFIINGGYESLEVKSWKYVKKNLSWIIPTIIGILTTIWTILYTENNRRKAKEELKQEQRDKEIRDSINIPKI